MHVTADRVVIEGPHATLLPATSLHVATGQLVVVQGPPGRGLTGLGLALAGRMRVTAGSVAVYEQPGGESDADGPDRGGAHRLRERAAVIDAPGVSEPDGALPLRVVVGEELALARRPASRTDVAEWLSAQELTGHTETRFEDVPADVRTFVLTTLAATRPGVRLLVLDTPDRHGWDATQWSETARRCAERGFAVVALVATTHPSVLPVPPARVGADDQPPPLTLREGTDTGSGEYDGNGTDEHTGSSTSTTGGTGEGDR
ncbi:ABC transporter ATP-binding protein [Haloechinothrix sp. YIM 98757]|uniref:ABC transporter ATP-binding protein n=1 Tax=Haloechinothrix aidingensis TaxID=2752311 RepID=A0A838AFN9_9PSEU|nr:ABC transporter ATP-binding protein [Haloechinothrix aidingensis]MBA0128184.1 ABC transporter ATP-binding protein [Haloechinothrix aidingensis]